MSKPVFIELDRTREIKFGVNRLIQIEEKLGKPISELNDSIKDLRTSLLYGLGDKELNEDKLGELMDAAGIKYCAEKTVEALNEATKDRESQKNLEKEI